MNYRIVLASAAVVFATASPARADVASIYAQVQGGGAGGTAMSGEVEAFHEGASGAAYGALVGLEFLFIDVFIEHTQYVLPGRTASSGEKDEFLGTWTQFMTGIDLEMDIGKPKGGSITNGKHKGGYHSGYADLGLFIGFGVGTGQQVDPPLDNKQLTDKGFMLEARLGLGWRLTKLMSFGITIPVQFGYFFKTGPGVGGVNEPDNQYASIHGAALLNLRFKFQVR